MRPVSALIRLATPSMSSPPTAGASLKQIQTQLGGLLTSRFGFPVAIVLRVRSSLLAPPMIVSVSRNPVGITGTYPPFGIWSPRRCWAMALQPEIPW